jgi:hypothetical protein
LPVACLMPKLSTDRRASRRTQPNGAAGDVGGAGRSVCSRPNGLLGTASRRPLFHAYLMTSPVRFRSTAGNGAQTPAASGRTGRPLPFGGAWFRSHSRPLAGFGLTRLATVAPDSSIFLQPDPDAAQSAGPGKRSRFSIATFQQLLLDAHVPAHRKLDFSGSGRKRYLRVAR